MKKVRFFIVLALVICLCSCGGSSNLDELLELGAKYLDEQNYKEAIITFEQAIKIDDKCAQAYIGLADAYICSEEYDKAEEILKRGYELTGDEKLKEMLDSLESGQIKTSDGLVRRMNHYNEKNKLDWYHTYTYDNQNRQSLVTSYDASGKQTGQVQCEYDEQGKDTTIYGEGLNGEVFPIYYTYDKRGNLAKQEYENGDYVLFKYDDLGRKIRYEYYGFNTGLQSKTICEYNGNEIIETTYDSTGSFAGKTIIRLDEQERWKELITYDEHNNVYYRTTYERSPNGELIRETEYDGDGNIIGKREYGE